MHGLLAHTALNRTAYILYTYVSTLLHTLTAVKSKSRHMSSGSVAGGTGNSQPAERACSCSIHAHSNTTIIVSLHSVQYKSALAH
jgi:hypothetical protein